MKRKFKSGDIVISRYRSRWTGIIVSYGSNSWIDENGNDVKIKYIDGVGYVHEKDRSIRIFPCPIHCCLVKVILDSCGREQRKPFYTILDEGWLEKKCTENSR